MANKQAVADSFAQGWRITEDMPKVTDGRLYRISRPKRESEKDHGRGVGRSFEEWAVRIYPTSQVVTIGTRSLRTIRSGMLRVIDRIDDELKRRDNGRH
jgi:hypothetical protein